MSRQLQITSIVQSSPGIAGKIVVSGHPDNPSGDWTSVFKGKFYRDLTTPFASQDFYTPGSTPALPVPITPPAGHQLIEATQFDVTNNASYAGRYTVYTAVGTLDLAANPPSTFGGVDTTIRVNEAIGVPLSPGDASTGFVSNVSTYYIVVAGGAPLVISPGVTSHAFTVTPYPVELPGRTFSGWGEVFNGDLFKLYQNFASAVAPANPNVGALWFDTTLALLKIWNGSWSVVNAAAFAPATPFTHTQAVVSAGWTINHNLGASAPFIVNAAFFVDTGGGVYKPILPSDVTYVSANQMTVTFSTAYAGFATVRL